MKKSILKLKPADNLWVALVDLPAGSTHDLNGVSLTLKEDVSAKHKFNECDLAEGEDLIQYGVLVGRAKMAIPAGSKISTQNTTHAAQAYESSDDTPFQWSAPVVEAWKNRTFMGYHRPDGRVGTANHWLVIPLVFCQNRNLSILREVMLRELGYNKTETYHSSMQSLAELCRSGATPEEVLAWKPGAVTKSEPCDKLFPNVDGVKFLLHEGGCGGTREDSDALCALLAGYVTHPNVAGVTVLSLGCQHAQIEILKKEIEKRSPELSKPLYIFEQQGFSSEEEMIQASMQQTMAGLMEANRYKREPAPLSKLVFGVECGGSDGFSGLSANPSIGQCSDYLVALGGSVMLSEFPELCGVEQDLINRCTSVEISERFQNILQAYASRAEAVGSGFDMNPSPGNIRDGLITDAMKSAGAALKGGSSPICGVLDYTEPCRSKGLNLLCTPGNDVESTTALAGSGANVILFSTGLGTPTGNPIVPVIKVSSNTDVFQRLSDIIDIDTGAVIRGEVNLEEMGAKLLELSIQVASGEVTPKAVMLGQDDFIPWKRGVSL